MTAKRQRPGPTRMDIALVLGIAAAAIAVALVLSYFVNQILATSVFLITGAN